MADGLDPVPLAMVVCDVIYIDRATGKRSLLGLFNVHFSATFPVKTPPFAVYVALTECRGTFPITLQVVDANEEREPVATIGGDVTFSDPLSVLEIDFLLAGLEFPEPGVYHIQLFAAGNYVCSRRLLILQPPFQEKPDE